MTDPEHETGRARRELARRLAPYVQTDVAERIAVEHTAWQLEQGWRPPLRPVDPLARGRHDPDVYDRGLAAARAALPRRGGETP